MSETIDAINAAEATLQTQLAALETAKAEAARVEALTPLVAAAPLVQQVVDAVGTEALGVSVSREEFDAMRAELNLLNARIADFNNRSGQRI